MGNQTTAGTAAAGAALGVIIAYLASVALQQQLPEAVTGAFVTFFTWGFCFVVPAPPVGGAS